MIVVGFGCRDSSEQTVEVVGVVPVSTTTVQPVLGGTPSVVTPQPTKQPTQQPTLEMTPVVPIPMPTTQPVATPTPSMPVQTATPQSGTGGAIDEPESLSNGVPMPTDVPDVPSGPVGTTDVDSGGGSGVVPGEGDQPGGLRLLAPPPPYEGLANEIFDLCDDQHAYTVIFARPLGPGEEMTSEDRDAIAFKRQVAEVSCDEPGGRRYVYMSDFGPSGAFPNTEAAVEDYKSRSVGYPESKIMFPKDIPLGYFGYLDWDFPLEDIDEIALVEDSVLVADGVLRGLVRNFSKTLFAREVTVTARPKDTSSTVEPASGRFPLTMQPGERAFFEIKDWNGSENPDDIDFSVEAKLSENPDITRAFAFGTGGTVTTSVLDEEYFKNLVPDFVYQHEKHKIDEDGLLMIEYISAGIAAPTSHPSLKNQVYNQTIKDLRVYMALTGDGKVYDIIEPPVFRDIYSAGHPHRYPQVVSNPTYWGNSPYDGFEIVFIPRYTWHIWVGQPGPLDYNPRTLPETPPPTPPPYIPLPTPHPPPN